jgi:hypothetical protein
VDARKSANVVPGTAIEHELLEAGDRAKIAAAVASLTSNLKEPTTAEIYDIEAYRCVCASQSKIEEKFFSVSSTHALQAAPVNRFWFLCATAARAVSKRLIRHCSSRWAFAAAFSCASRWAFAAFAAAFSSEKYPDVPPNFRHGARVTFLDQVTHHRFSFRCTYQIDRLMKPRL